MWITWFIRRFPARESRCRFCSPEEASRGADSGQVHQSGATGQHERFELGGGDLNLGVDRGQRVVGAGRGYGPSVTKTDDAAQCGVGVPAEQQRHEARRLGRHAHGLVRVKRAVAG
jgi:hypothetical protein